MEDREQGLSDREKALDVAHGEVEQLKQQQLVQLEATAGLSVAEAHDQVVRKAEDEARHELTRKYWELEQQYKDEADDNARKYVVMAIERLAADVVAESTVTTVPLPNDEMKGRLIGREGRNIRALEQATGVDLIVDDTPEAVTLSCFDPIRREIAPDRVDQVDCRWPHPPGPGRGDGGEGPPGDGQDPEGSGRTGGV